MNAIAISQTFLKKAQHISDLLAIGGNLMEVINEKVIHDLRRRISQQKAHVDKSFLRNVNELTTFYCENDTRLNWSEVFENLVSLTNLKENHAALDNSALIEIATLISSNIVTYESEIPYSLTPQNICQITRLFPIIFNKTANGGSFLNLHEFVYTPGARVSTIY